MGRLDDAQLEGKLLLLAGDLIIMLLLALGTALAFISGYRVPVDPAAVTAFCAAASAVSLALHKQSHPWGALAALAGLLAIFWIKWEEILPVLQWLEQEMSHTQSNTGKAVEEQVFPVMLLLCACFVWVMGWAAVRARRWYLAALLSVVVLLPAIQSGTLPAWGAMLAAFTGWGAMLLTALFGRRDPDSLGRAQLLSLAGVWGLTLLLVMSLPMEGYRRPQWATDARDDLIRGVTRQLERFVDFDSFNSRLLADFGIDLSLPSGEGGGAAVSPVLNGGAASSALSRREDLLRAGPRRYSGRQLLSVRTSQPDAGRLYLSGGAMGRYTGTAWEWERDETGDSPFFPAPDGGRAETAFPSLYPAMTAGDNPVYTMNIRDISYPGSNFYPYRLMSADGATDEGGRLTLAWEALWEEDPTLAGEAEYELSYIPGDLEDGFTPLTGAAAAGERQYRLEVLPRYLEVPEAAREALRGNFPEIQEIRYPSDAQECFSSVLYAASQTARLLDGFAEYDPNTPAMGEEEEDFAAWFLREKRGYCIHFATAGALLLRMQGIPARFATGYVADFNGRNTAAVRDSDAHAWVEVYISGYGWHPVEMTPGYAGGANGAELAGPAEEPDVPGGDAAEEAPEEEAPDGPDAVTDGEPSPEDESAGDGPGEEPEAVRRPWRKLAAAIITLAGAYAASFLPRRLERQNPDTNRSVICAYRRCRRLLGWGGVEEPLLEELGRKAKFSQHTLTPEERDAAWNCLEEAFAKAKKRQGKWKGLLFPLLKPLV